MACEFNNSSYIQFSNYLLTYTMSSNWFGNCSIFLNYLIWCNPILFYFLVKRDCIEHKNTSRNRGGKQKQDQPHLSASAETRLARFKGIDSTLEWSKNRLQLFEKENLATASAREFEDRACQTIFHSWRALLSHSWRQRLYYSFWNQALGESRTREQEPPLLLVLDRNDMILMA